MTAWVNGEVSSKTCQVSLLSGRWSDQGNTGLKRRVTKAKLDAKRGTLWCSCAKAAHPHILPSEVQAAVMALRHCTRTSAGRASKGPSVSWTVGYEVVEQYGTETKRASHLCRPSCLR